MNSDTGVAFVAIFWNLLLVALCPSVISEKIRPIVAMRGKAELATVSVACKVSRILNAVTSIWGVHYFGGFLPFREEGIHSAVSE